MGQILHGCATTTHTVRVDLPRFGGELIAHSRAANSNWAGL
jgi:hypothetical protein